LLSKLFTSLEFFNFYFLPPKTILGPITGGSNFSKSFGINYIIRGFLFPLLYKVSEFFLNLRDVEIIFSTDLLKKYLFKKTLKRVNLIIFLTFFLNEKDKKKKLIS
jgi:hypothetical protein